MVTDSLKGVFDFNPRLREGGDIDLNRITGLGTISIHASVKEATTFFPTPSAHFLISIHASVKEATSKSLDLTTRHLAFQSTPP